MKHNHKHNHSCCVDSVAGHLSLNKNPKEGGGFYYTCPMHPEIKSDKPGLCPECGMNLIEVKGQRSKVKSSDYDKHAGHSIRMFAQKFWVSLILTAPILLYSELPERFFGWQAPQFPGSAYHLSLILGSIVFFYGGWIFMSGAWRELQARLPGMMTLIALAIGAAYFYSVFATFYGKHTLFWELTTLITVMLLGHLIEMKAVQGAQSALKELSKLLPDTAEIILGTSDVPNIGIRKPLRTGTSEWTSDVQKLETKIIPLSELKEGALVFVRPGGKIPADGIVIEGKSDVNESMITGESKPVQKSAGNEVIAGTINSDGALKIKVAKIGENTFLAGVMRLVAEAQASKSRLQMLSDRAAFYLTIVAIATGTITFVAWLLAKAGIVFAVERLVAVLVIACPHALGLAVPLVASISTTMAARNGLLVRQRLALEAARKIDIVLFDKTGTLTKGEYGVTKIFNFQFSIFNENDILQLAASVDAHSEHFISKAIVAEAKKRDLPLLEVKDFTRIPGKGVKAKIFNFQFSIFNEKEIEVFVGGEAILKEAGIEALPQFQTQISELAKQGQTIIYVIAKSQLSSVNSQLLGAFALADLIRDESREAIRSLKEMGVKVAMITGDSEDVARWVAEDLEIDEYFARVLPEQKTNIVRKLQEGTSIFGTSDVPNINDNFRTSEVQKLKVAMVGDGINDAPALTQADLGVAIGAGTNVAIESAGIILVRNDPRDIPKIIKLSRLTYNKMLQNLFWATAYNLVALPLAAGALASYGILLQPAVAAIFMSLSTVIVAVNAVLLRKNKL